VRQSLHFALLLEEDCWEVLEHIRPNRSFAGRIEVENEAVVQREKELVLRLVREAK